MLVSEIIEKFEAYKNESGIDENLYYMWLTGINNTLYDIKSQIDPSRHMSKVQIDLESGTDAYELSSNGLSQLGENSLTAKGTGVYSLSTRGVKLYGYNYTEIGSSEAGFYIDETNINFTPSVTQDKTLHVFFIPKLADISALTDTTYIDFEELELVIHELDALYRVSEEDDSSLIQISQQFANNARSSIMGRYAPRKKKTLKFAV